MPSVTVHVLLPMYNCAYSIGTLIRMYCIALVLTYIQQRVVHVHLCIVQYGTIMGWAKHMYEQILCTYVYTSDSLMIRKSVYRP